MKILTCVIKEWLLLWRDKIALAILFIMPLFFVLVISLLQTHTKNGADQMPVLLYSADDSVLSRQILDQLNNSQHFKIIDANDKFQHDLSAAQNAVAKGQYQILVVFPENMGADISNYTKLALVANEKKSFKSPVIQIYFDPAVNNAVATLITQALIQSIQQYQLTLSAQLLSNVIGSTVNVPPPADKLLQIQYANIDHIALNPNPVQQNVPAWAIFGMFFIVIPIAGILIKEKELKIDQRLFITPVSKFILLFSRILAFTVVNLLQLIAMFLVGIFVLPLFGLPALQLTSIMLLILIGIITAVAASSCGLLIGSFARTYEQASALGPLLVVLAAAIGGIMLPTYLMPASLQFWSQGSPLNWAQTAFIDLLVRHGNFISICPSLIKLTCLSIITLYLVYWRSYKYSSRK